MSPKEKLVIAVREKTRLSQKGAKVRPRVASQQERQRPREGEGPAHCKQNCVPRKAFIHPAAGARIFSDTKAPNRIMFHQSTSQQVILRNLPQAEGKTTPRQNWKIQKAPRVEETVTRQPGSTELSSRKPSDFSVAS